MEKQLDSLPALALFARIVEFGSLSAAASFMGLSRSVASKQLKALETRLGARLLQRTTRKLTLTEAGEQIVDEARKVAEALDSIVRKSEELQGQVRGHLRVSCSTGLGKVHLVPLLKDFCARYPNVDVQLLLEDRFADLIAEQIDVAIRIGHLPNSSLVARRLGETRWQLSASPDYLARRGEPSSPQDLLKHDCLYYRNAQHSMNEWGFHGPRGHQRVTVRGALCINDATALVDAAKKGMGILLIDRNMLGDALQTGELRALLPDWVPGAGFPIYALYPARQHLPEKTRVFVEYLAELLAPRLD